MGRKDKILLIINSSLGELHVALPILKYIRQSKPSVEIYALYISRKIQNQVEADEIYYSILSDVVKFVERKDILPFLLKEAASIKMILKEQNPVHRDSIIARIRRICWNAKFVLYPHAYALYDYEIRNNEKSLAVTDRYDNSIIDYLLTTSAYDFDYFAKDFDYRKVFTIGALGYTDWWREQIVKYSNIPEVHKIAGFANKNKVLFTLRGPHRDYLTNQNFDLLMQTSLKEIFKLDDVFLIVKPHPRQDIKLVYNFLGKYPQERWMISNLNTFTLATQSQFTLSFWSSAITDSLAVGTPAIEYYRYHDRFTQTCDNEAGEIVSYYTKLNFAIRANSERELNEALRLVTDKFEEVKEDQIYHFDKVFSDRFDSKERLTQFLEQKIFSNDSEAKESNVLSHLYDYGRVLLWSIKNRK